MADDSFDQFQDSIYVLLDSAQYDQALEYLDNNSNNYSAFDFELSELKATIFLNSKHYQKAYEVWSDGHTKGYFYLLHPAMPSYKELKDDSAFLAISEVDLALRQEATDKATTKYEVVLPDNYDPKQAYPMILILHGGGRTMEQAKNSWQANSLNKCITVYLESYRYYNYHKYGWATGDQRGHDEIAAIYNELVEKYNIDRSTILLGGISAGGSMALDIAFNNIIPVNGVIGICPGKPRAFADSLVEQSQQRGLKLYFVSGETDFYKEYQKEMTAVFDQNNLVYQHHILDGLGHDFPENFPNWIDKGMAFLIQK